jgi:hypothetical protein
VGGPNKREAHYGLVEYSIPPGSNHYGPVQSLEGFVSIPSKMDTLQMVIAAHVGVKSPANAFLRVGKKLTLERFK